MQSQRVTTACSVRIVERNSTSRVFERISAMLRAIGVKLCGAQLKCQPEPIVREHARSATEGVDHVVIVRLDLGR